VLEKGLYTHPDPDGRTEVVEATKKYDEGDGGAGFSIYIQSFQRERDTPSHSLDVSPEAKARCSRALALGTYLGSSEEENDAGACDAAGSRLTQQGIISVMGPASSSYEKWLL